MEPDEPDAPRTHTPDTSTPELSTRASVLLLLGCLCDMQTWLLAARARAARTAPADPSAPEDVSHAEKVVAGALLLASGMRQAHALIHSLRPGPVRGTALIAPPTGPLLLTLPTGLDVDGLRQAVAPLDGAHQEALRVRGALRRADRDRALSGRHLVWARALLADLDRRATTAAVQVHGILRPSPYRPAGGP